MSTIWIILIIFLIILLAIVLLTVILMNQKNKEDTQKQTGVAKYVISLESRKDRLDKFLFSNKFTNIKVIEAIDGREVFNESDLTKGEFGCYQSHVKAWKAFIESDYEYALIFEDDAHCADFNPDDLIHYMKDLDILLLSHNYIHLLKDSNTNLDYYQSFDYAHGATSYLISKESVKKLSKSCYPISGQLDFYITNIKLFKVGILKNKLCIPFDLHDSDTQRFK